MSADKTRFTTTEAVAVFHDVEAMEAAVEALLEAGFSRSDVSLLASESAVEKKLGHFYARVEELEDNPDAPRVAFRSTEAILDSEDRLIGTLTYLPTVLAAGTVVASAGVVAALITGTAIAGALIGTVLARWIGDKHAQHLQEQLEHGGLLVWVRTPTKEKEEVALRILMQHADHDVHLHELPRN